MARTPRTPHTPGTPRTPGEVAKPETTAPGEEQAAENADVDMSLPDQSEIDPYKITRAVKTRQGWVCPAQLDGARNI